MTYQVVQGRDGAWRWEIADEYGETYLRSERCFVDLSIAEKDLEISSHLISFHLKHR